MTVAIRIREQSYQVFIGEALELLRQIEEGLLNLLQDHSPAKIHNLVRAAHSIKGGSAQLNLTHIHNLSRRLEKSFSVLRQKNLEISFELKNLLLQGYDCLRVLVLAEIHQNDDETTSVLDKAEPIFALIEEQLAPNSTLEIDCLPTAAELGVNIESFILNTEVALALEHLENILNASQTEELAEPLQIQLELFLGFGEFLELSEFINIAQTTLAAIQTNPKAVHSIGEKALKTLRKAHQAALQNCLSTEISTEEITHTHSDIIEEKFTSVPSLEDVFAHFAPSLEETIFFSPTLTQLPLKPTNTKVANFSPSVSELKLKTRNLFVWQNNSGIFTLPYNLITEYLLPCAGQTIQLNQQKMVLWREQIIPIYELSKLLSYNHQLPETCSSNTSLLPIFVISWENKIVALESAIDRLVPEAELTIKKFGEAIAPPNYIYGCTLSENENLLPVIDVSALLSQSLKFSDLANTTTNQNHTFLIIDDSDTWRHTLSCTLEKAGYKVLAAENGQEGLKQLQQNTKIQGIISDIEMPTLNGFEFLTHRLQDPQLFKIPVFMLSSCNTDKHRQLAKQLGATGYFTKPYNEQEFLATLQKMILNLEK